MIELHITWGLNSNTGQQKLQGCTHNKEKNNYDLCSKQSLIQSSTQPKSHTWDWRADSPTPERGIVKMNIAVLSFKARDVKNRAIY